MTRSALLDRECVLCRRGAPVLSDAEREMLLTQVPGWVLADAGTRIERRFRFKAFADAFAFVEQVAVLAEAQGHHPDICFGWGYATLSLQTKVIQGLHANDFVLAAKIEALIARP